MTVTTATDLTFDITTWGPETGDPVLLLHGWPQNARAWSRVAPLLADQGLRVIAIDQRGYSDGARPTEVKDYATETLAQDVIEIADALGIDTFHLVSTLR